MLRAELAHLFGRRRVQALLVVLALVPAAVVVALRLSGHHGGGSDGPTFLNQVTDNGVFASLAGLTITLPVFLPMAVAIVAGAAVIGAIPELLALHPWLLTQHWTSFGDLLRSHVVWTDIRQNLYVQAGYVAVFGSAAWARFTTKDVLA